MKTQAIKVNRGLGGKYTRRKHGNKTKDLNITSLIDILTILLVFMIKNISMDATQKNAPEGMLLPTTVTTEKLIDSGHAVFVKLFPAKQAEDGTIIPSKILYGTDNIYVGSLQDFLGKQGIRETLLSYLKMEAKQIVKAQKKPCLLIQSDKDLECKYITEFIKFSASAAFANIYFSTIHAESRDEVLGL